MSDGRPIKHQLRIFVTLLRGPSRCVATRFVSSIEGTTKINQSAFCAAAEKSEEGGRKGVSCLYANHFRRKMEDGREKESQPIYVYLFLTRTIMLRKKSVSIHYYLFLTIRSVVTATYIYHI